jgi:hypothetical protein
MKSKNFEEITIRFVSEDVGDYLISKGFFPIKRNHYEDLDGKHLIVIEDETVSCYSKERSSVFSEEPKLEMYIGFVPHTPILNHLLKGIYFVRE